MSVLFKKHKNLIPLIILGLCCIYTFLNSYFNSYEASDGSVYFYSLKLEHYLALAALIIDFLVYFLWKSYFRYVVILTLVLGLFNVLIYLPININIVFIVSFQALSFMMGLFYIFLNYGSIYKKGTLKAEQIDMDKIEKLKLKYLEMTNEELKEINEDKRFTAEAKMAVEEVIKERKKVENDKITNDFFS